MSVYRPQASRYYQYDFEYGGRRFHGSTERTNRREAEQVEAARRDIAKKAAARSLEDISDITINEASARYWNEVGQYHSGADDTFRDLGRLVDHFGKETRLADIADGDVAKMVAWRRRHRVCRGGQPPKPDAPLISPTTVNRSTTEVLKKLFTRAKDAWGAGFDREPKWRTHMLDEPDERVRELIGDEGDRLYDAVRDDYAPFLEFAHLSGMRRRECLLRWEQVDWVAGRVRRSGKGGGLVTTPITSEIRAILWPLRGHHPTFVFTYVAQRTRGRHIKGLRYPITYSGCKTAWRRARAAAGVVDFRFHDLRHDMGTKLLRKTGNLKLVQRALNHKNIKTTTRYAHVLDEEVAAAMETLSESRSLSRSAGRKVS